MPIKTLPRGSTFQQHLQSLSIHTLLGKRNAIFSAQLLHAGRGRTFPQKHSSGIILSALKTNLCSD